MCELLALSCHKEVNIAISFTELQGSDEMRKRSWGIGFYRQGQQGEPYATIIKEPISARDSIFNYFLQYGYVRSRLFLSHFRLASVGSKIPLNTHPFQLMLDPRPDSSLEKSWIFAHSGTLLDIQKNPAFASEMRPHGNTDSEHVFCYLMGELQKAYLANGYTLSVQEKRDIIQGAANRISQEYPHSLNFIMSDGYRLYVYYGGCEEEGGLWRLQRTPPQPKLALMDPSDGLTIQLLDHLADETAILIAAKRLTPAAEGTWQPCALNELLVIENGRIIQ